MTLPDPSKPQAQPIESLAILKDAGRFEAHGLAADLAPQNRHSLLLEDQQPAQPGAVGPLGVLSQQVVQ